MTLCRNQLFLFFLRHYQNKFILIFTPHLHLLEYCDGVIPFHCLRSAKKEDHISAILNVVVPGRIELPTPAFSVPCSTD